MYIGHWSKFNISVFLVHSAIRDSVDARVILRSGVKNPPTLNVIPATSWVFFGRGPCWDPGLFQAIIYISSEHNVSKNKKNQLFSTVLS